MLRFNAEQRQIVDQAKAIQLAARKDATRARPKSPKADRGREPGLPHGPAFGIGGYLLERPSSGPLRHRRSAVLLLPGGRGMTVSILPPGPFGCILADPPWSFLTYGAKRTTPHRTAEDHYVTMAAGDLRAMPVEASAAKDCALFMWVVDTHLDEAIELGKAWGFSFKTIAFIWAKTTQAQAGKQFGFFPPETVHRIGMGYWTRKQAETCLLFTRGKPKRIGKGVRQIIEAPRREHSRKPDETHARIQQLVAGPYLELFAREPRPGWTVWGNQTDKFEVAA